MVDLSEQEYISYTPEKMDGIKENVQKLIEIVKELEQDFPGRHFTLDGHLIGSIGEVMASYYYGIKLFEASAPCHDGEVDGRLVQIKITQQDSIVIREKPEYLIALYLNHDGLIYEIYNGPGDAPYESASKFDAYNHRHMRVNKLMELDKLVDPKMRIQSIHKIEKMKTEYKNKNRNTENK